MGFSSKLTLAVLVVVCVPILLAFATCKLYRSRRPPLKVLALLPAMILVFLSYQVFVALYPNEEFYREEWRMNTGFDLPRAVEFMSKSAGYPDIHGDYSSAAVFEMAPSDVIEVESQLRDLRGFEVDTSMQRIGISDEFRELTKELHMEDPETVYRCDSLAWFRVGFFRNGKVVVFERHSS